MAGERQEPKDERSTRDPAALLVENAELRRREAFLTAIIQVNSDAAYVKDAAGRYLMINEAGARLVGKSAREVVGRDDTELFEPETARRVMAIDREILAEGAVRTFEEVATSAGVTRVYQATKGPYRDEQGRTIGIIGISRDVTRQKQAEAALSEALEYLERLLEHAPAPIFVTSRDGRVRLVNRAWEETFGMWRQDVIGRPVEQIFPPELSRRLLDQNREVIEAASPRVYEEEFDAIRGRVCLYMVKFPLRDAAGVIVAVGGISIDVTQLRGVEASLEESRRRLQALFDNALDGIWLLDDAGRFVDANPAVCAFLGYTREEFSRMGVEDVVPERSRGEVQGLWRQILSAGRMAGEYTQVARDGTPREVDYRAVAHILPGLHLSVNRDVTERRRAERDWLALNAALEDAVEGISRIDAKGCFRAVNRAYAVMLGHRGEELIGRDWRTTVHPDDREIAEAAYRTMLERGRCEIEVRGLRRDDSSFWKQNVKVRSEDEDGRFSGHYCFAKDITERKEAEAALRGYSGRLQDLSRRLIRAQEDERRHIARELHDEFGQALTAIKLNVRGAMRDPTSPATAVRLEESLALVDRTIGQVRDLTLDLRPLMLDDLGLADALRSYVAGFAERSGVEAVFGAEEIGRLDPDVETACYRLAQEALTNVARHAGAGRVRVELASSGSELRLVVADDGSGFDAAAAMRAAGRVSLGLLSMRERATLVGGRFEVASGPGRGTEIRAAFPLGGAVPGGAGEPQRG